MWAGGGRDRRVDRTVQHVKGLAHDLLDRLEASKLVLDWRNKARAKVYGVSDGDRSGVWLARLPPAE